MGLNAEAKAKRHGEGVTQLPGPWRRLERKRGNEGGPKPL
jgi:hypothetical protein